MIYKPFLYYWPFVRETTVRDRRWAPDLHQQQKPTVVHIAIISHEHHSISNHQHLNCLFNYLFRLTIKSVSAPHYWTFISGNHQWLLDSAHKGPMMQEQCHIIFITFLTVVVYWIWYYNFGKVSVNFWISYVWCLRDHFKVLLVYIHEPISPLCHIYVSIKQASIG